LIDTLKKFIGGGGFGEVFVVDKPQNEKKMAMKVIRLGLINTEEPSKEAKAAEAEISIGIKLGQFSKYLVQLTEYFFEGEYCCLIMEFCSGGDLQKIFDKKNRIPQPV
jgi:serine/threonine protein kinase